MNNNKISVVINTYNASKFLARVLDSVKDFDEIVICDMESTDDTLEIAQRYGCKIVTFKKEGVSIVEPARQFAIDAASHPWVLVVDADELVTPALHDYLYAKIAEAQCPDGISIPRKNYFMGRFMHSSYPDYILRFFRKDKTHWPPVIHTSPVVDGVVYRVPRNREELAFEHLANDSIADIMRKNNTYSDYEVERRKDKQYGVGKLFLRPVFRMFKAYILKGGWRDGVPGLVYALLMGTYQMLIVAKVIEKIKVSIMESENIIKRSQSIINQKSCKYIPDVSIIVPIYNVEKYLRRCIDSILSQTFISFELLLIDDGSTDASGAICDEYALMDRRIHVTHQINRGVSAARNVGLDKSVGKYVCFVDSDDWVTSDYLATLMEQVQGFDVLFFGFFLKYNDESSMSLSLRRQCAVNEIEKEQLMLSLCKNDTGYNVLGYAFDKIFRRNLIEKYNLRFDENICLGEDEIFALAYCLKAQYLKVIPDVLYCYSPRVGGLASQKESYKSCYSKYKALVDNIIDMESSEMLEMWHKRAYHTLQDVAKTQKYNLLFYLWFQLRAFWYKINYNLH